MASSLSDLQQRAGASGCLLPGLFSLFLCTLVLRAAAVVQTAALSWLAGRPGRARHHLNLCSGQKQIQKVFVNHGCFSLNFSFSFLHLILPKRPRSNSLLFPVCFGYKSVTLPTTAVFGGRWK